jgi:hypothetical protein
MLGQTVSDGVRLVLDFNRSQSARVDQDASLSMNLMIAISPIDLTNGKKLLVSIATTDAA